MERDRYHCFVRHVPLLPCSLYCNLRGEEGTGAERNRRFFLLDIESSSFAKFSSNTSPSSHDSRGYFQPPLHVRLHSHDRFPLFQRLMEIYGGESASLGNSDSFGRNLEEALEALSLEGSETQSGKPSQSESRPASVSLETLLPTTHCILSDPSRLQAYLRNHVRGLMQRCRAYKDSPGIGKISFAGQTAAASALTESALWYVKGQYSGQVG